MTDLLKITDDAVISFTSMIKRANMNDLMFGIVPDLCGIAMPDEVREYFAQRIIRRLTSLTGERPGIETVRAMVAWSGKPIPPPEWCKQWVHIKNRDHFYSIETKQDYSKKHFNLLNSKHLPDNVFDSRWSISGYALEHGFIPTVDSYAYLPMVIERITKLDDGSTVLNTFYINTVPATSLVFTNIGLKTIDRIKQHIGYITGSPERAHLLTKWLAHLVQRPGEIVGFAPLIVSKVLNMNFLCRLLDCVLGLENISYRTSNQVRVEAFNGWANGSQVVVFLEVKGTNYYKQETVDGIADYISNSKIAINARGSKVVTLPNTTNFLAFTKHPNFAPDGHDSRRWQIFQPTKESLAQYKREVGSNTISYFADMSKVQYDYQGEIRKFFMEYDVSK